MNQPVPAAITHFTQIANEEKKAKAALRKAKYGLSEAPVATRHFADLGEKKAVERDAARSQTENLTCHRDQ